MGVGDSVGAVGRDQPGCAEGASRRVGVTKPNQASLQQPSASQQPPQQRQFVVLIFGGNVKITPTVNMLLNCRI